MFRVYGPGELSEDECSIVELLCRCFSDACTLAKLGCGKLVNMLRAYGVYRPVYVFAYIEDNRPLSTFYILERKIVFGGSVHRVGGVAGVCTDPGHRRLGLARRLLTYGLEYAKGDFEAYALFTTYGGIAHMLYRRLGFRDMYLREYGIVTLNELPQDYCRDCIGSLGLGDVGLVMDLYQGNIATHDGAVYRDVNYIKVHILDGAWFRALGHSMVGFKYIKGSSRAYALTWPADEDGVATVAELAYSDVEAARELLSHVAEFHGAVALRVHAPSSHLAQLGILTFRTRNTYMVRGIEPGGRVYVSLIDQW